MDFKVKKVLIMFTGPKKVVRKIGLTIGDLGAGLIGNYKYCSVISKCLGTFMPNNRAKPMIGKKNKLEVVKEEKLEIICDVKIVREVVFKIKELHPYDEVVVNIIPLLDIEDFK